MVIVLSTSGVSPAPPQRDASTRALVTAASVVRRVVLRRQNRFCSGPSSPGKPRPGQPDERRPGNLSDQFALNAKATLARLVNTTRAYWAAMRIVVISGLSSHAKTSARNCPAAVVGCTTPDEPARNVSRRLVQVQAKGHTGQAGEHDTSVLGGDLYGLHRRTPSSIGLSVPILRVPVPFSLARSQDAPRPTRPHPSE
jgi:hypothetical protein